MKKVLSTFVIILWVLGVFSATSTYHSSFPKDFNSYFKSIHKTFAQPLSEVAPKATHDNFTTNEDVVLNNNVSTNDTISPDSPNVWTVITLPLHGILVFNPNGTFQYTPVMNYFGTDNFTYQICDIDGDCDTAQVSITISSVNEFPYAFNDNASVIEDGGLFGSVAINDILSADSGNMWGVVTPPAHGMVIFNTNGTYTYTPTADFFGIDSIIYKIYDVDNDSDTATLYVSVTPINDKPIATNDLVTTLEDIPLVINPTLNDNDVDGNFNFASLTIITPANHGTTAINGITGMITYTPNQNYNGNDTIEYSICDDGTPLPALCDTAFIFITLTPVNDLPVANTDYAYTNSYTPVTINVLYNDSFGGDGACACAITATNGTHGTTSVTNNGTATNPTDDKVIYTPNASYHGTDSFTYTITDIDGEHSTATVYIDVTNMFAPTLTSPVNGAIGQMPNALISWTAVPGAFQYKAEVSTDSLFTTKKVYSTNLSATYTDHLLFYTTYYWRVKAYSPTDSSGWSVIKRFKVLKTVTITQPVSAMPNCNPLLHFKWNAISGIANYEYEIDSSLLFTSPLLVGNDIAYNKTDARSEELAFGTNYYLRMRAMHSSDTSEWSDVRNFITLDTFNLLKPTNSVSVKLSPVVKLEWTWTGSKKYEYALATDSLFNDVVYTILDSNDYEVFEDSISISTYTDTLRFGQKYFWKVRGVTNFGTSEWTKTWRFVTEGDVTLLTPVDGAVDISRLPIFKWKKIEDIGAYNMEIDVSSSFTNPTYLTFSNDMTADTFQTQLQPLTVYFWRMRAITHVDSTNWSAPFQFRTVAPIGIEDNLSKSNISIYPNPSSTGRISLQIPANSAQKISLSVVNMVGQIIYGDVLHIKQGNNLFTINLQDKENGIYFIRLQSDDNTLTRKIILNR